MIELYAIWPNLGFSLLLALLSLSLPRWLPFLLYPFEALWNTLLYQAEEEWRVANHALLRWHSASWLEISAKHALTDSEVPSTNRNSEPFLPRLTKSFALQVDLRL